MSTPKKILFIGYGNPGRLDDGLGPALAERVRGMRIPGVTVESDYQLNVEDAAQIAEHERVIFADASTTAEAPFTFHPVQPEAGGLSFSSHSVSAPQVLGMARDLFHATPEAHILAIRGYAFDDFGERLSAQAQTNLEAAALFLQDLLSK
ncbi:MAG: hydrogenase maturation protease [Spartobacteria bacterium]|nr:hydrogenase maturation protease [Spartobacteria bacterium]